MQKCHMVFHVFWEGLLGRSTPQHGFTFCLNCSSCRCRLLGGFGFGDEFCPKNVERPHGFLSCSLQLEMSYGLWGWFGWEGFFTKKGRKRVVCVAAGGTTPHPSSIRVHCQNVAPAEEGGRPVRGRAQRHMVFSLFNCISLRCRLLEGFG